MSASTPPSTQPLTRRSARQGLADSILGTRNLMITAAFSVVALMILAVQHGERVALSMDSRGFGAYGDRTELDHHPWRWRDWFVVLVIWALTILCWHAM